MKKEIMFRILFFLLFMAGIGACTGEIVLEPTPTSTEETANSRTDADPAGIATNGRNKTDKAANKNPASIEGTLNPPPKSTVPRINKLEVSNFENYDIAKPLKGVTFFTWNLQNQLTTVKYDFTNSAKSSENYGIDFYLTYSTNGQLTSIKKIYRDEAWRVTKNAAKNAYDYQYERNFTIQYYNTGNVSKIVGEYLFSGYDDFALTKLFGLVVPFYHTFKYDVDNLVTEQIEVSPASTFKDVGKPSVIAGVMTFRNSFTLGIDNKLSNTFELCKDQSSTAFNVNTAVPCALKPSSVGTSFIYPIFKDSPIMDGKNLFPFLYILGIYEYEHPTNSILSLNKVINYIKTNGFYAVTSLNSGGILTKNLSKNIIKIDQDCPGKFCQSVNISYFE
jgi:hypothetical protein